jgi:hypothetical protein
MVLTNFLTILNRAVQEKRFSELTHRAGTRHAISMLCDPGDDFAVANLNALPNESREIV